MGVPAPPRGSRPSLRNDALVHRSSKAVHEPATEMAGGLRRAAPDPGTGTGIELTSGDPHGQGDLLPVGEALAGDGGATEPAPPAFDESEPSRTHRDEGVVEARVLRQPRADGATRVAGEVVPKEIDTPPASAPATPPPRPGAARRVPPP